MLILYSQNKWRYEDCVCATEWLRNSSSWFNVSCRGFKKRRLFNIINYVNNKIKIPLCYALEDNIIVGETGNVYACPELENISLGNLKEKKLSDILSSKEFLQMKEKIRKLDCPGCWNDCAILNNLNHTYHGLIKYPAKIASLIVPPRIWNGLLFH